MLSKVPASWLDEKRPERPLWDQREYRHGAIGLCHALNGLDHFFGSIRAPHTIHAGTRQGTRGRRQDKFDFYGSHRSCQDSNRDHDASTPHRAEANGIAERAARRATESTPAQFPRNRVYQTDGGEKHGRACRWEDAVRFQNNEHTQLHLPDIVSVDLSPCAPGSLKGTSRPDFSDNVVPVRRAIWREETPLRTNVRLIVLKLSIRK